MPNKNTSEAKVRYIYVAELMRKGWSNKEIVKECQEKYGVSYTTATKYTKRAIEYLLQDDDSNFVEQIRKKQQERTEYILRKAIEDRDWQTANKILDNFNKLMGLYEMKQKIELSSDEIQFRFGISSTENNEENVEVDETKD